MWRPPKVIGQSSNVKGHFKVNHIISKKIAKKQKYATLSK